jgi:hypothetical protein
MRKMKMLTAFCLITPLIFSPLSGMDDHGANVVITKKDGTLAQGELLAVKLNALVVSVDESSPVGNASIAIEDIGNVKVIKKSKVEKGMLWGALIGGGLGAVGGLVAGNDPPKGYSVLSRAADKAKALGLICGLTGLFIGAIAGAVAGTGKTFHFENLSKEDRDSALLQLSDYAAIKGVR